MAEFQSNAPQMFQLPGPAQITNQPGLLQGISSGLNQGLQIGQTQQGLNLHAQELAQQKAVQQAQIQQMRFEQGSAIAKNALEAYNVYGDDMGPQTFNAFKQGMNLMAPGSIDPNVQWDPSTTGKAMQTVSDAFKAGIEQKRPWPEVMGVISTVMGRAGTAQRAKMQPLLQSAQNIFGQQQTNQRIQSEQMQNTQRDYATHANPLIQAGSGLNTVRDLLSKGDAESDALAKVQMQRLVADGSISPTEVEQLTKAGGPLEKIGAWWSNAITGKLDDYHRNEILKYIPTKVAQLNNSLQSLATAFPGAQPAKINMRMTGKSKSGKDIYSEDGGKTWLYQ